MPPPAVSASPDSSANGAAPGVDPEIQMNPYNMNEILFLMQCRGVQQFHAEFSDHGGELGVFLFFAAPSPPITIDAVPAS